MATHEIMLPDKGPNDRHLVVWDDEAGTVHGDHYDVPFMQQVIAAPKPVTVGSPSIVWELRDPGHDPAEFPVLLYIAYPHILLKAPLRTSLPSVFDGVDTPPPEGELGEQLYVGGKPLRG